MNGAQQHRPGDALIGAALLRSRHLSLIARLAAGAFYGATAGALLHDHASIAGAVMVAVWTATVWLPTSIRAPGDAPTHGA
jgi:hypothetical protein